MIQKIGNYYLDRECLTPPQELQQKVFPRLEETEAMNNAKSERDQDIATRCFMNLLRWFRVVLFQDAVFLRRKYPALNIWLKPIFNNPMFETFAQELLHETEHGETPHFVRISKAMPDLAHQLHEQHGNLMNTMSIYHQSILDESKQGHTIINEQQSTGTYAHTKCHSSEFTAISLRHDRFVGFGRHSSYTDFL